MSDKHSLKVVPIATRSNSPNSWTGEQCIEDFVESIKAGKIDPAKVMIVWFSKDLLTGALTPHRWFAQVNKAEEIALLELAKQMAIDEWKT